ncbi:MAG: 3-deoxy-manno-octulosonate cytidylyltransferase [Neisseria sp.]|nr:3-deoxy-manno-octulosonate cytidylyltransferase [Neisseria sp.]
MSLNPEFAVIIPARLSSTRLPEKALADIGGKPMVVRTAEAARRSGAMRVAVATDNERIMAACATHGIEAVMTDVNHHSGTDRLAEAAVLLKLPENALVVNVQGDEPLIDPMLIDRLAAHLAAGSAPMATAAHPLTAHAEFLNPNVVKVVLDSRQHALYFSRAPIPYPRANAAQGLPESMNALRHIGIYAYRVPFLHTYHTLSPAPLEETESLEQLRVLWHGYPISVLPCEHAPAAGVDTAEDLARVRAIFSGSL